MRGFSLIELLVVISIISLLTLVATPSFSSFIKRDRIVSNANQLHSLYKFARSEAIKREQTVLLEASSGQWRVLADIDGTETVMKTFTPSHQTINVVLQNVTISAAGELKTAYQFVVTDNDDETDDHQLCILQSGQSWLLDLPGAC
ncbi:GspH/FimT family pseudopilin [Pseudoalteromonas mariniglutinosa]|uniref:GspH/FimT family pseudopilin n=1 Tax=Pseudoalteromonas mariniglutinosa TaxID=206042 RepID=UPI00385011D8